MYHVCPPEVHAADPAAEVDLPRRPLLLLLVMPSFTVRPPGVDPDLELVLSQEHEPALAAGALAAVVGQGGRATVGQQLDLRAEVAVLRAGVVHQLTTTNVIKESFLPHLATDLVDKVEHETLACAGDALEGVVAVAAEVGGGVARRELALAVQTLEERPVSSSSSIGGG